MKNENAREIAGDQELLVNRTGILLNPELGAELVQGARQTIPSSEGNGEDVETERAQYAQEGLPIGSYPLAVNGTEIEAAEDLEPVGRLAVLLDKLGERLAFERQGTRLYETFIQKIAAMPSENIEAPSADALRHICEEELEHFKLLQQAIVELGGDATVQTPSADIAGVLSHGALQIVSDPRTTISQALQAALTAELADNDGWKMLQDLSEKLDRTELAEQCGKAYEEEQEHLENVRTWLTNMITGEALGADGLTVNPDEKEGKEKSSQSSSRNPKKKTSRKRRKR